MTGPRQGPAADRGTALDRFSAEKPEAPALADDSRVLSWNEWNRAANRLADALERRGVRAGDRIGVRMMNRIEWFVVDAALAKLGAVRVAIAWRLRPPEVRHILENSGARGLFFDDEDAQGLAPAFESESKKRIAGLDLLVSLHPASTEGVVDYRALFESGRDVPRRGNSPRAIVYTSGTTGRPKGVERTRPDEAAARDAFQRLNEDLKRSIPYRAGDRNLLVAPLNHAAAPSSALATHARGGTVYVQRKFDPEEALGLIERHRITVTFMVPTMLNRIVRLPEAVRSRYDLSSIRIITTGASVCPGGLKREVTAIFGPCIYESYGSTETGVITILTPEDQARHADSCGRLLDGVDVRIVDDDGQVLPRGAPGQIFIKSPSTIDAYVGESDFDSDTARDGYFTAGDVGRLDEEGFLYILDRRKDMIISGGVNIYPAEIEAVLRDHPSILDAAVFGVPNADFGEEVRAVCERVPGREVDARGLLAFAAPRLADYKMPRTVEFTEELPRNAIGKVLKRELRAPYWAGAGRVI